MLVNFRNFLISQAYKLYYSDAARRSAHTFVQTFVAVLLVGLVYVTDFKSAIALLAAALAAGFSAVKTALVARYGASN